MITSTPFRGLICRIIYFVGGGDISLGYFALLPLKYMLVSVVVRHILLTFFYAFNSKYIGHTRVVLKDEHIVIKIRHAIQSDMPFRMACRIAIQSDWLVVKQDCTPPFQSAVR